MAEEMIQEKESKSVKTVKILGGVTSTIISIAVKIFLICIAICIFVLPYRKAEVDNTVILLNPITSRYYSFSYTETAEGEMQIVQKQSGVANKISVRESNKTESGYFFGAALFNSFVSDEKFDGSLFDNNGRFGYWQALKLALF